MVWLFEAARVYLRARGSVLSLFRVVAGDFGGHLFPFVIVIILGK